ncbi:DciA family protein [Alphaproteobacteria bacterium]|nr:DciA family protein [Alphaproteobacteria bacterium]
MSYHKNVRRGLRQVGQVSGILSRKLLSKKGNFLGSILQDWSLIMGEKYVDQIKPEKISFPKNKNKEGTLYVSVSNGSLSIMTQYLQPLILEKVNQFFGYNAFEKVSIRQTKKIQKKEALEKEISLTSKDENSIKTLLEEMPEGPLKESLEELGKSLYLHKEKS